MSLHTKTTLVLSSLIIWWAVGALLLGSPLVAAYGLGCIVLAMAGLFFFATYLSTEELNLEHACDRARSRER